MPPVIQVLIFWLVFAAVAVYVFWELCQKIGTHYAISAEVRYESFDNSLRLAMYWLSTLVPGFWVIGIPSVALFVAVGFGFKGSLLAMLVATPVITWALSFMGTRRAIIYLYPRACFGSKWNLTPSFVGPIRWRMGPAKLQLVSG